MTPTRRHFLLASGAAGLTAMVQPTSLLAAEAPLSIVATTGMIADTARAVAGDLAEVKALMGPGVDPHAYRQTRTDILAMSRADLILWNGLYLEAQLESVIGDLSARVPVRAVGEAVPGDLLLSHDTYAERFDPHVWMDPTLWRNVVLGIRDALSEVSPENSAAFAANADAYLSELDALAVYAKGVLASVPEDRRVLVTAHDAFNYFGRAYGFEVIGVQGISTESEAGLNRVTELVNLLVDREIGAVFVESSVSDRSVRALIEGAASRGQDVGIGGQLFSDAMGQPGTYEGTYIGMIDHNVTTIASALGGVAPERGISGRLSAGI